MDIREKIRLLEDYFSKRPDVCMAFVFGSYAKDQQMSESDFDIAVYFTPQDNAIEWEETKSYKDEDIIWGDIERIVGIRTDLVVLNRAPSTLAFSIIQEGIPVLIKDRSLYLRFLLLISSAAEDFRNFVEDFWKIKQRSASLSDIDRERLIRITDFLETELADFSGFKDINQNIYQTDAARRRNLERWVENIVNSSIDTAKIILASEKRRIPQTYREILTELAFIDNFSAQTAQILAQFSKLRNILAHEYLDIRFAQIRKFLNEAEPVYKELLQFVKTLLEK